VFFEAEITENSQ